LNDGKDILFGKYNKPIYPMENGAAGTTENGKNETSIEIGKRKRGEKG